MQRIRQPRVAHRGPESHTRGPSGACTAPRPGIIDGRPLCNEGASGHEMDRILGLPLKEVRARFGGVQGLLSK
jgi:hypothetical protein